MMISVRWIFRLLIDLVWFGVTNRAMGMSIAMLLLLFLGLLIIAVKITAPFIYTLF